SAGAGTAWRMRRTRAAPPPARGSAGRRPGPGATRRGGARLLGGERLAASALMAANRSVTDRSGGRTSRTSPISGKSARLYAAALKAASQSPQRMVSPGLPHTLVPHGQVYLILFRGFGASLPPFSTAASETH